jgi:hypothetical protein
MPEWREADAMKTFDDAWSAAARGEHGPCYLLIDCAGVDGGRACLPDAAFAGLESLFTGDLAIELADVGPWLAQVATQAPAARGAVVDLLQRQAAVLVVMGPAAGGAPSPSFAQVHRHFRKFNVVYDPEGKPLFFRYYDPRVVLDVLRVMTPAQLAAFFGDAEELVLAPRVGGFVRCRREQGRLAISDGAGG